MPVRKQAAAQVLGFAAASALMETLEGRTLLSGEGGNGLLATYFATPNFTGSSVSKVDANVNFSWGDAAPDASLTNRFAGRWTGEVQATVTGDHVFETRADGGVRLWVNDKLLIDSWTDQGALTTRTGTIALTARRYYQIKLEYTQSVGAGAAQLFWTRPGDTAASVIPQANFYPGLLTSELSSKTSWLGNTYGTSREGVREDVDAIYVDASGTVYFTGGGEWGGTSIVKDGQYVKQNVALSGAALTANQKYLFVSTRYKNADWTYTHGIRRHMKDGSAAVPFTGGVNADGAMLPLAGNTGFSYGIAADSSYLYVSDTPNNTIQVYDAETMALLASTPVTRPMGMTLDGQGRLWVISRPDKAASPAGTPQVLSFTFDAASATLAAGAGTITMAAGDDPTAVAFNGATGRLMVTDNGPDKQVKMYDPASPDAVAGTFGERYGVFRNATQTGPDVGKTGDRLFIGLVGVGADAAGNVYVANNRRGPNPNEDWQYTDTESMYLESYAPQSAGAALNWRWMGMGLFEVANADPSSETDVYSRDAHYGVNYDSAGNLAWTLKGVTLNPMKYPNDPRIDYTGLDTGFDGLNARALTQVVRIQGRRFLVTVSKNVETLNFFRFDEANQGEIAIHSAAIAANDGSTSFIWTDTDGDGAIEQAEKGTGVWAKKLVNPFVDTNGNVWWPAYWGGNAYLHYIPFGGFDARGNPIYSAANAASVAVPSFYEIRDVSYDAAADAVYVMGYTKAAPRSDTPWYGKGNTIARISNWSTGNRTPDWQVAVPYKVTLAEINSQYTTYIPMTMTVAGGNSGHVFVGYGSFEDVHIYKASDGSYAGVLYPDAAAVGDEARKILVDVPRGWQVTKRSNGQYVVFIEDDLNGKITTVQWTPGQHAAPSAPANVTWRQQGTSNIHLTWDTATGTDSYAVRRASSPDGAYTTVGVARGANSREFTDVGLAAGTTYYYKVVALNAGGESAGAPAHAVRTASPFRGAAWAVPGRIEAEDFDRGGQGAGYHDLTPTNVDGHYRPSEAVEIRPSGDAGGGYAVWVEDFAGGEYVNYTINVAAAGYYDLGARVKVAQAQGHALQFLLDGETLGAPVTVFTGNAPEAQTFTAPGVYLPAGDHQLRVVFNGHQILLNYLTITPSQTFINDAVPDGATTSTVGGDGWNWVAGSPAPASGTLAHASNDTGTTAGEHTHAFFGAATPMYVQQGSLLWAQVYLDATSTPDQVMLQWRTTDGSWEHRAYWGANALALGTDNTGKNHPSRYQVSPNTPLKGRWMTIGVPASAVGLEGQYVDGMAFTLNKGKATWDAAGGGTAAPPSYPVNVTPRPISTERVDLSWGAALTATGYNVYRGTAPGVYGSTPINASPLTATSYTDLNLTPSTRYYYVVRAINAAGTSIASDEVSASTYAPGFGKLTGTLIGTPGSYDANSTPDKAVDGNLSTFYDGRTANGNWIGLDLGAATTVTRIAFAPRASFGYRMNGGKFQASNAADFSAGVIDLYTIPSAPTAGVLTTVDVTPAEGYRYVRYVGPANSYGEVAEMEYWRVPAAAPTVTTSAAALAYTENDAATAVDPGLTITGGGATLVSATVQITGNYVTDQDALSFVDQGGITGAWDAATGTLSLTGSASAAEYQAALRSVTYVNTSDNPNTGGRTVSITVRVAGAASNTATRGIAVTAVNDAPTVVTAAASSAATSTTVALSVLGADVDGSGEAGLTYTWLALAKPEGSNPTFSASGTNPAKSTTVTFNRAGSYTFRATLSDGGLSVTSDVTLAVDQSLTTITVTPGTTTVTHGGTTSFTAAASDQFGTTMSTQPALTWSVAGPNGGAPLGTVSSSGVYTAPASGTGTDTVTAASGSVSGSASVTVTLSVPAAPSGLSVAAVSSSQIDLTWADNAANESGFQIQRATDAAFSQNLVSLTAPANASGYSDSGLSASTTYHYRVRATNAAGDSAFTAAASATTAAPPDTTAPAPVNNTGTSVTQGATGVTVTSSMLRYTDDAAAAADVTYTVTTTVTRGTLRKAGTALAANGTFTQDDIDGGRLTYDNTSNLANDGFTFTVSDNGAAPNTTGAATFAITVNKLVAPAGFAVTAGDGAVTATWAAVTSATGYKIRYGTTSGSHLNTVDVSGGNSTTTEIAGLTNGTTYYFLVAASNAAGEGTGSSEQAAAPAAPATGAGSISYERWNNVTGTAVTAIPVNAVPASTGALTSFELAGNSGDNYGVRVRGYLTAPTTGSYTFWVAGDDNVELWLSTDAAAANKTRIAHHTGWTASREWNKYAAQKSAAVALTAGSVYYVEALMKEGTGGDNLAVGWLKPGQTGTAPSEVIPGSALSPFAVPTPANGSFEATPAGGYTFRPSGTGWTFSGQSGITATASGNALGAPAAPSGTQAAFLQSGGSGGATANGKVSQTVNFANTGHYDLQFNAALRSYRKGTKTPQQIAVYLNGSLVGTFSPTSTSSWNTFTARLTITTAGSNTIDFRAVHATGDTSAFLDNIRFV